MDKQHLSKAQRKEQRKEENRQWMVKNKGGWSEDDPNPRHTSYYRTQIPELDQEWDHFTAAMRKDLQSTFRISDSCNPFLSHIAKHAVEVEYKRPRGQFIEVKGEATQGAIIQPVSWCPNSYELAVNNAALSREKGLEKLNKFLLREVSLGHFVRQELVSMIPACLIDINHNHAVLDICAAPGSKTEQLLGMMTASVGYRGVGKGILVANDIDGKRIGTLQQRLARSASPQMVMTNGNAALFTSYIQGDKELFDRILCDVPCSGDGTFRKCPHLWRLFKPRMGLEFHEVQVSILLESVRVLKVGGLLAYSTCSLNPLEDEAVVAAALSAFPGHLELVACDIAGKLPGLRHRPGLQTWRCDEDVFTLGDADDKDRQLSKTKLPPLTTTMHAPSPVEAQRMMLNRCLRIFPHDQNTGGFFIAVLRKTAALSRDAPRALAKAPGKASGKASKPELPPHQEVESLQVVRTKAKANKGSAVQAMTSLGYNPKVSRESELSRFRLLECDEANAVAEAMGLQGNAWRQQLVAMQDKELHVVSLVSHSAHEMLSSWGPNMPVVQCGVPVAATGGELRVDRVNAQRVLTSYCPSDVHQLAVPLGVLQGVLSALQSLQAAGADEAESRVMTTISIHQQGLEETNSVVFTPMSAAAAQSASLQPTLSTALCAQFRDLVPALSVPSTLAITCTLSSDNTGNTAATGASEADGARKRRLSKAEQRKRAKQKVGEPAEAVPVKSCEEQEREPAGPLHFSTENVQQTFSLLFAVRALSAPQSPGLVATLVLLSPPVEVASQHEWLQHWSRSSGKS